MDPSFFLRGELTVDGLRAMRDQIDRLLGELAPASSAPAVDGVAQQKAKRLRNGLGDNTWGLLYAAAKNFPDEAGFTFTQLAELLDVERSTVRAWHRGASKVIKKLRDELGDDPPVFQHVSWNGIENTYSVPTTMREAILAQGE